MIGMAGVTCDECLRRAWLIGRLSGHINRGRRSLNDLMEAADRVLIGAVAGKMRLEVQAEYDAWGAAEASQARMDARRAGLELICRCQDLYPSGLLEQGELAPAVLHVAGGVERFLALCEATPVAIVGARRSNDYGRKTAYDLASGVARTGITVISGMAVGIDSAAHRGALDGGGNTVAVMPCSANLSYPASSSGLHRRIVEAGVAVSELPPGTTARAWSFRARNRIVVALSGGVVVVQALEESGTMRTAAIAEEMGRHIGAVPGPVELPASTGPHLLIKDRRAALIENAIDVLDLLHLPRGARARRIASTPVRPPVTEPQRRLLQMISNGNDTAASIAAGGILPADLLKGLAELELSGWIRQVPGGQFVINRAERPKV